MRKILSIVLLVAMMAGLIAVVPSSQAANLAGGNIALESHYFDGSVQYKENYGTIKAMAYYDTVDVKTTSSSNMLVIDGVMDEGEWGDPIISVSSDYSASNVDLRDTPIYYVENTRYSVPSGENTYTYWTAHTPTAGYSFSLYSMWDEDYLYVAAVVHDVDGHKNLQKGADIWDGDSFQFRVDPYGANARYEDGVMPKGEIEYTWAGDTYTKKATPWTEREDCVEIGNFCFAYVTSDSGHTTAWDAARRYLKEYDDGEGNVSTSLSQLNISPTDYWGDNSFVASDPCYATVKPVNHGTTKNPDYYTTYEVAIPWSIVTYGQKADFTATAGTEVGFSAAVLDASQVRTPLGSMIDGYIGWITCGSGICGYQHEYDIQTAGGANVLTLSSTSYKDYTACEHTYAPATCTSAETCTKCGYKRGFAEGHSFSYSDVRLPSETVNGSIKAVCTVCGQEDTYQMSAQESQLVAEITTETTDLFKTMYSSGFRSNWYDRPAFVLGEDGTYIDQTDQRKTLYMANGRAKTSLDTDIFGYSVLDLSTNTYTNQLYYIDGSPAVIDESISLTGANFSGTYFAIDSRTVNTLSLKDNKYEYCASMEIYFDKSPTDTYNPKGGYTEGMYYFFGPTMIKYYGGFACIEKGQKYVFFIGEMGLSGNCDLDQATMTYDLTLEDFAKRCEVCVEVPASLFTAEEWHKYDFMFDNTTGTVLIFWDNDLKLCASSPKYVCESDYPNSDVYFRKFELSCYLRNLSLTTISYAAANNTFTFGDLGASTFTATINGVANEYAAGETVNYSAPAFDSADAARLTGWEGDTDLLTDVTAASGTFTMPDRAVTLTPKYTKVGDTNGDGKINAQDANYIAQIIVGSAPSVAPADINADGKVNATDANLMKKIITGTYAPVA